MAADITPFEIAIEERQLEDLRERLRRTRWPEPEPVSDWSQGIPLAYLQELCEHWSERVRLAPHGGGVSTPTSRGSPSSTACRSTSCTSALPTTGRCRW